MKQINITTGKQRPIKRLNPLRRDTKECEDIMKRFMETMPDFPIKSIQRIQNLHLWELFCRRREQLGRLKQMNLEERMLFHGTDFGNVRSICSSNFDLKLAGRHGSVYGKGIYFARNASFAHKYCKSTDSWKGMQPLKAMFLARVLVGEFTLGEGRFCSPPSKDKTRTSFYDSCVDEFFHPNIFVVFDSSQIYPEYLIEF
ncbi:protein mono-ADP-ribosyltransferase PARP11-like [Megalops cyprinoides]|uniref:protein mono-ADP-ribosyltransferase PARP11-like n=1 Tax=Megalops cyprinoides TaxID=118141 RepID=UPI001863C160|nr:protein mono-ADP-ribosyltransferase PARP11-like [Megalops cyprinoides]